LPVIRPDLSAAHAWLRQFRPGRFPPARKSVASWIGGLHFEHTLVWLINLLFVPHHGLAIWIPIGAGVVWSLLSFALVRYWSAACGLRDIQRLAIFFGALLGSMGLDARLAGWTDLDLIATFVFQLLAVMGFVLPARKIWQRCRHRPSRAPRVSLMRSALLS
jgi:hypothetical protein